MQPSEYAIIAIWSIICVFVHIATNLLTPMLLKIMLLEISNKDLHEWCNRATSSFHAATLFLLSAYYWIVEWDGVSKPISVGRYEFFCLKIMIGYLLYDLSHELILNKSSWGDVNVKLTIFHHIIGLISISGIIFYDCGIGAYYNMYVFLAEASTPFLNHSWLLNSLKLSHTLSFKLTAEILLIIFFFCRVILAPVLLYDLIRSAELGLWNNFSVLFRLNVFIVTAFLSLNFYWYKQLISVAIKKLGPKRSEVQNVELKSKEN